MADLGFGRMYKCSLCKEDFWAVNQSMWAYKSESPSKMFCSYSCLRNWQKQQDEKNKKYRK